MGLIFDIKKFAVHDGPGIRTTVFLKGCPLACKWCHNPESIGNKPELSFTPSKCIGCGYCFSACPNDVHVKAGDEHSLHRDNCVVCGKCAIECHAEALQLIGREMTVDEVMDEVMKDAQFYETSQGGLTVSGGEPLSQYDFTHELLTRAKELGLHTCLDTSGLAPFERLAALAEVTDIFLYDLKETDPDRHIACTGVPLEPILDNLRALDAQGTATILRCPLVPGVNDTEQHLLGIAEIANSLTSLVRIDLQPYHPLGQSKNPRIGRTDELAGMAFPDDEVVVAWRNTIQAHTEVPVELQSGTEAST